MQWIYLSNEQRKKLTKMINKDLVDKLHEAHAVLQKFKNNWFLTTMNSFDILSKKDRTLISDTLSPIVNLDAVDGPLDVSKIIRFEDAALAPDENPKKKVALTEDQIYSLWHKSYDIATEESGFGLGNGDVAFMLRPIVFARELVKIVNEQI